MATLTAFSYSDGRSTQTDTALTAEKILERLPVQHTDELEACELELQKVYRSLEHLCNRQVIRLLDEKRFSQLLATAKLLRQVHLALDSAICQRRVQENDWLHLEMAALDALLQRFPALRKNSPASPLSEGNGLVDCAALLEVARLLLIAESDLYFNRLARPTGRLDFFETEQPRLTNYLCKLILDDCPEQGITEQDIQQSAKRLKTKLSRPLNAQESAQFKALQEGLAVQIAKDVVVLRQPKEED